MEVQAYKFHMSQFVGFRNHVEHIAHGNTELVFSQSRRDVRMGMRPYIGVQTESHTGHFALGSCQFIDDLQFGYALYVETEDIVVETEIDFPVGLSYACINNL